MKIMQNLKKILALVLGLFAISLALAAQPVIEWESNLGGSEIDMAQDAVADTDGGIVVVGYSRSADGDVSGNNGELDLWLSKVDAEGNLLWEKNYGGSANDVGCTVSTTSDGGFIVGGGTGSTDGDISWNVGAEFGGVGDAWILKLDSEGNLMWENTLGSLASANSFERTWDVQETNDGGYFALIESNEGGADVSEHFGFDDYWLVRTDELGNILWEKSYGGSEYDFPRNMIITENNEILLSGHSDSMDGDLVGASGEDSFWLLKLDMEGNTIWNKSYEGGIFSYVTMTSDGGYMLAGVATANVGNSYGEQDYLLRKLDAEGNEIWKQNYGGSEDDNWTQAVVETAEGNFIVCGSSRSNDIDISENNGFADYWIFEIDPMGNIVWEKSYGGSSWETPMAMLLTSDGGIIIPGNSSSSDGDVGGNNGSTDIWLLKLSGTPSAISSLEQASLFQVYPNPSIGNFSIELENQNAEKHVELIDIQGKTIYSERITESHIDLNNIPPGNYMLRVVQEDLVEHKQVIVAETR